MRKKFILSPEILQLSDSKDLYHYFWTLPKKWFEPPNYRRGGWSGVIKHTTANNDVLFVKLQSNSVYKSVTHPFKGRPTFYRELINTQRAKANGVKVLEFIYYEQQGLNAVLVSKSLEGYQSLNVALKRVSDNTKIRQTILVKLADNLINMHKAKIKHGSLYEKHVLVRVGEDGTVDLRFIDFEKARKTQMSKDTMIRDMYTLFRHSDALTEIDKNYLFSRYKCLFSSQKIEVLKIKIAQKVEKRLESIAALNQ